jgi:glycosyltransferase involved in cell wall biosynthesis
MKFLVIVQDLRVSGTSEGIVSRSFLAKLRKAYPDSVIDVFYLKHHSGDDRLDLLPVDCIETHVLDLKIPFFTKWFNKIYWRLFHQSLLESHINKVYGSYIGKIAYEKYNHIFIRSSGLEYETILGAKDLPILRKSIINFHDPYPVFWCAGSENTLSNLELFRVKEMNRVVMQAKTCISPAGILSQDMEYLYGSRKKFYILPHQYSEGVFDFSDTPYVRKRNKKITVSYHGAIQFGRNVDSLLDAYQELIKDNFFYKENTEFVLRLKGKHTKRLIEKYSECNNIIFLGQLDFANSSVEQAAETDILIILENGPIRSNILVGKAPFVASLKKTFLSLSPESSEMRNLIKKDQFIANSSDKAEIKQKLENLIINKMNSNEPVYPFGDYFSDENFKKMLDKVLFEPKEDLR